MLRAPCNVCKFLHFVLLTALRVNVMSAGACSLLVGGSGPHAVRLCLQAGGTGVAGALKAHGWGSPVTSSTMPASKGQRAADRAAVYIAQVRHSMSSVSFALRLWHGSFA